MIIKDSPLHLTIACIEEPVLKCLTAIDDIGFDSYNSDGCNGYVFFGHHSIFQKRVAVKFYYFGEDSHEEVFMVKNIKHPNILNVWDARTAGSGWAYFITDEVANGTIENYIGSNRLNVRESIKIIRGILCGVGILHESPNCLLHRDLKPANILLDSANVPIIADFGSIKRIPQNEDKVNSSKNSTLYAPPESLIERIYTVRSDIYQIGLIMYQILGGALSYDPLDYMNKSQKAQYRQLDSSFDKSKFEDFILLQHKKSGRIINFESLPYYIHQKHKSIIRKAAHPDPGKRYADTADFLLDLHCAMSVPNCIELSDDETLIECQSARLRISKTTRGFIIEKSRDMHNWRKVNGTKYFDSGRSAYEHACSHVD